MVGDEAQRVVALEREVHRLRCEQRRLAEELDWAHERARVLERVIVTQAREIIALEARSHPCSHPEGAGPDYV